VGFETFDKHDDSVDEHLDGLLKAIMALEEEEGKKIDAQVVTWRGMITKVSARLRAALSKSTDSLICVAHVSYIRG
jgi:hypothetical protein